MDSSEIRDRLLELARMRLKNRLGAFEDFRAMLEFTPEGNTLCQRAQMLTLGLDTFGLHLGRANRINEHLLALVDAWAEKQPPLSVEPLPAVGPVRLAPKPNISKAPEPINPVRGASIPPSRSPQPAKWQMWNKMPTCALWEAVCLTYDIEPDGERHDMSHWLEMKRGVPHGFPTDFADRLRVAQANVSTQGPIEPVELRVGVLETPRAKVRLSDVAKFAIGCEWEIPPAMRALAGPAASDAKGEQEGKNLRGLDAMRVPGDGGMSIGKQWLSNDASPESQDAPTVAESADLVPEPDDRVRFAGPAPLTTSDIAFCFDGLHWDEARWKKPLGDKPKWLQACIAIPARRGVSETRWNPVLIGAALVHGERVGVRSVRGKFQTQPLLAEWLDAWKTYEADNFDND